jgi:capsular polysaccharide biosynthesis protein
VVIGPGGAIFEESTWAGWWLERDRALASLKLPQVEKLEGSCYTIASLWSEGYWHWMLEALPRLFALEILPIDNVRLIVSDSLNRWRRESLDLIGFGNLEGVPLRNR